MIEPASASDPLSALHAYPSLNLTAGYPDGGEDQQRAWISFNGSTPGVLHRGPVLGDSRVPTRTGTLRRKALRQVIRLLVRSCHHWQLMVCNQFYELFAARHAPRVSRPTSKPGRPRVNLSNAILAVCSVNVCKMPIHKLGRTRCQPCSRTPDQTRYHSRWSPYRRSERHRSDSRRALELNWLDRGSGHKLLH